nr:MAG TPA: hypothetical protein [Bacteriophage sp.]
MPLFCPVTGFCFGHIFVRITVQKRLCANVARLVEK